MSNKQNPYCHLSSRSKTSLKENLVIINIENDNDEKIDKDNLELHKDDQVIITSACDLGVTLNGGRRGAKHGPECIVHQYSKIQNHQNRLSKIIPLKTLNPLSELEKNQNHYKDVIKTVYKQKKRLVHLGGGHDHVYPLISTMTQSLKKEQRLYVLNIDAHLDTRDDGVAHSGTPFRQWIEETDNEKFSQIQFLQVAIQEEYNAAKNYELKKKNLMQVVHIEELIKETQSFTKLGTKIVEWMKPIKEDDFVLISLDTDGIDSVEMSAVSAPNPSGVTVNWLHELILHSKKLKTNQVCFGLYEYNPIFDDLACSQGRKLAYLINSFF